MSTEIKVIDKAFQILNSFSEAQNNLSLKQIAKVTSQNKSTIIRICRSLIKHNFLIKKPVNYYDSVSYMINSKSNFHREVSIEE